MKRAKGADENAGEKSLSPATEKELEKLEKVRHDVAELRRELLNPDPNVSERFVIFNGGDYAWIIRSELYRAYVSKRSDKDDAFRLVRYGHSGAEKLGTYGERVHAREARDEFYRVLVAREILYGYLNSTNDLEWRLKIVPIEKDDWEDDPH